MANLKQSFYFKTKARQEEHNNAPQVTQATAKHVSGCSESDEAEPEPPRAPTPDAKAASASTTEARFTPVLLHRL